MEKYYAILKRKLTIYYFDELIKKIQNSMKTNEYSAKLISDLFDNLRNDYIIDDETKKEVIKLIAKNDFFVPNINGEISEEQWHWCHIIWEKISTIDETAKEQLYKFTQKLIKKYTVIGKYRINSLNNQYHIVLEESE